MTKNTENKLKALVERAEYNLILSYCVDDCIDEVVEYVGEEVKIE